MTTRTSTTVVWIGYTRHGTGQGKNRGAASAEGAVHELSLKGFGETPCKMLG